MFSNKTAASCSKLIGIAMNHMLILAIPAIIAVIAIVISGIARVSVQFIAIPDMEILNF